MLRNSKWFTQVHCLNYETNVALLTDRSGHLRVCVYVSFYSNVRTGLQPDICIASFQKIYVVATVSHGNNLIKFCSRHASHSLACVISRSIFPPLHSNQGWYTTPSHNTPSPCASTASDPTVPPCQRPTFLSLTPTTIPQTHPDLPPPVSRPSCLLQPPTLIITLRERHRQPHVLCLFSLLPCVHSTDRFYRYAETKTPQKMLVVGDGSWPGRSCYHHSYSLRPWIEKIIFYFNRQRNMASDLPHGRLDSFW